MLGIQQISDGIQSIYTKTESFRPYVFFLLPIVGPILGFRAANQRPDMDAESMKNVDIAEYKKKFRLMKIYGTGGLISTIAIAILFGVPVTNLGALFLFSANAGASIGLLLQALSDESMVKRAKNPTS